MEPIILELEREENDLLIIAHESVLRVLYGYLMACNAADIPKLEFPRDEIIEVMTKSGHSDQAKRFFRSYPPATTTSLSASKSLTSPKASSQAAQKTSKFPSLPAEL
jgi:broad specificity phosphatase PhoE